MTPPRLRRTRTRRQRGATYISPYDDPDVMAGAATVALEMLADQPALDAIVAPLGGGGLLAGTAVVAKAQRCGDVRPSA